MELRGFSLTRQRGVAHGLLAAGLGGLVMLAVHPMSRFYPACPVYEYFHLLCPGCGATRALTALLRGDPGGAWRANALFVCGVPLVVMYGVVCYRRALEDVPFAWPPLKPSVLYPGFAVVLLFTLVRNWG